MIKTPNNNGALVIITGILWVVITVMTWVGLWFEGLLVGFVMILLYLIAGSKSKGKISTTFLIYPIGIWFVLWMVSFYLVQYYSKMFRGMAPTFTVLGFHPSFAWVFIAWIGSILTLSLGFYLNRDKWLSAKDWEEYQAKIQQMNKDTSKEVK